MLYLLHMILKRCVAVYVIWWDEQFIFFIETGATKAHNKWRKISGAEEQSHSDEQNDLPY